MSYKEFLLCGHEIHKITQLYTEEKIDVGQCDWKFGWFKRDIIILYVFPHNISKFGLKLVIMNIEGECLVVSKQRSLNYLYSRLHIINKNLGIFFWMLSLSLFTSHFYLSLCSFTLFSVSFWCLIMYNKYALYLAMIKLS